jgi:BolA family transcriptional regulator, general stress-responsive regulator
MSSDPASDNRAERMRAVLAAAFSPAELRVVDDSFRHAGHAGARPGGQTHYSVLIVSDAFAGLSRVERHRRVNQVLHAEFADGLHALALTLLTPDEHPG